MFCPHEVRAKNLIVCQNIIMHAFELLNVSDKSYFGYFVYEVSNDLIFSIFGTTMLMPY